MNLLWCSELLGIGWFSGSPAIFPTYLKLVMFGFSKTSVYYNCNGGHSFSGVSRSGFGINAHCEKHCSDIHEWFYPVAGIREQDTLWCHPSLCCRHITRFKMADCRLCSVEMDRDGATLQHLLYNTNTLIKLLMVFIANPSTKLAWALIISTRWTSELSTKIAAILCLKHLVLMRP